MMKYALWVGLALSMLVGCAQQPCHFGYLEDQVIQTTKQW